MCEVGMELMHARELFGTGSFFTISQEINGCGVLLTPGNF